MYNKEQVFLYMKEEIEALAAKEEESILQVASMLESEMKQQVEAEAKNDVEEQIKRELNEINAKSSLELTNQNIEITKELIKQRDIFVETIFDEAKQKLVDFAASKDYQSFLIKKIQAVTHNYQLVNPVLQVRKQDLDLKDDLIKAYGKDIDVKINSDIKLGGFIIEDLQMNLVIDETLDLSLVDQKDWFYQHSGLLIK